MDYYVVKFNSPPTQTEPNPNHEMVLRAHSVEDAQRRALEWLRSENRSSPTPNTMKAALLNNCVLYDGRFYEKPEEKKYEVPTEATKGLGKKE